MQLALVEFARNVCGLDGANTSEVEEDTKYPVIDILDEQKEVLRNHDYGASMRLGSFAAILDENSIVYNLYNKRLEEDAQKILNLKGSFRLGILNSEKAVLERHRHRYEVNPVFVDVFQDNGMRFSGWHIMTNGLKLMEFIELPSHKYFVATQAHPEFKSSLENPAPLFFGFVKACLE